MNCCEFESNGESGDAGTPTTPLDATTLFEVADFAVGQPVGEVASGPLALVDVARSRTLAWEAQRAGATSYAIGVNGLRYDSDATNTAFNSGVFTSSWIRMQLATLYSASWAQALGIDATCVITIEAYFDLLTFISGFGGVAVVSWGLNGSPGNAAARMRGAGRGIRSATQVAFGKTDGAEGAVYTTAPGGTANTLGAVMGVGNSVTAVAGARASLAAGWPLYRNVVATPAGPSANPTNMLDENSYLAIGMYTGNTTDGMVTQLRSLRIRAWR